MSAPKENRFWELRATHGRELIFSSTEILWEAAKEYFEATTNRPWIQKDWVGKEAIQVERETTPPFTLTGMYIFLDISHETWNLYRKREDFIEVVTRIENIIYTQKFEGAAVGAFNSSIISMELGLKQKTDITTGGQTLNAPIIHVHPINE